MPVLPDIFYTDAVYKEFTEKRYYGYNGAIIQVGDYVFNTALEMFGEMRQVCSLSEIVFDSGWTVLVPVACVDVLYERPFMRAFDYWFVHDMIPGNGAVGGEGHCGVERQAQQ